MKDFAEKFYKSKTWQKCRDAYAKSKRGFCEPCLDKGEIVPGEIVHHIVELTLENINDPDVTLNWDNLRLVCRNCHGTLHGKKKKRYKVDEAGRVTIPPFD